MQVGSVSKAVSMYDEADDSSVFLIYVKIVKREMKCFDETLECW
jgi:hypothetical protein